MADSILSPRRRSDDVAALAGGELDLLVIGGGVVGAGTALDAASRGMSVGLVEALDWASGTSSHSTKLIHGGLRYLQLLDFGLVREALIERGLLLDRLAPHLVRQLRFCYPLRHRIFQRAYTASGIALYDVLGRTLRGGGSVPRQRQRSKRRMYRENPGLRSGAFHGGIEYFDAQVDDARFVLTLVRTALSLGAHAASRVVATELCRENGRVVGARLVDRESGETFLARSRNVVIATGVERTLTDGASSPAHEIEPSKGIHLVVPKERIALSSAVVTRTAKSVLFIIPWGDRWIIGTTDTPWEFTRGRAVANAADIDYLLGEVNSVLERPLARSDVESVYSGLRPLLATGGAETVKASREHAVDAPEPGLFVVSGGKFTTYRVMARDVVDAVSISGPGLPASRTDATPLVGAAPPVQLATLTGEVAQRWRLPAEQAARLVGRYGTLVGEVLAGADGDRSLLDPLDGSGGHFLAEVRYAAGDEGALHLDDVLRRRLRLDLEGSDRGRAAAVSAVTVMGDTLGWSSDRRREELERYAAMVAAEARAESCPDDRSASAVFDELFPIDRW